MEINVSEEARGHVTTTIICLPSITSSVRDRSLFIAWGGGEVEGFGEETWFLGEQKEGSVVTENPRGRITENFGRIQGGNNQICLENEDIGGGDREIHEM